MKSIGLTLARYGFDNSTIIPRLSAFASLPRPCVPDQLSRCISAPDVGRARFAVAAHEPHPFRDRATGRTQLAPVGSRQFCLAHRLVSRCCHGTTYGDPGCDNRETITPFWRFGSIQKPAEAASMTALLAPQGGTGELIGAFSALRRGYRMSVSPEPVRARP